MRTTARFVHDIADIDPADTRRFGGKATGLARMARAGLSIPPAFVIGTDAYRAFRDAGGTLPPALAEELSAAMRRLETATGKGFADPAREGPPLLVSVRSGAAISMPGMMDTILNLGLDAAGAGRLAAATGNAAFVVDTWTRFWRMFGETVLGLDGDHIARRVADEAQAAAARADTDAFRTLEAAVLREVQAEGEAPGAAPMRHLEAAIGAVFRSWDSRRAVAYRTHHGIAHDLGTAVTVQAMVFGNMDARSGSGVAFTRDPNTGAAALYGEYLTGRQGEDLVAGTHTPINLADPDGMDQTLRTSLVASGAVLERLYRDAVDIEFTIESGLLFLLQVRPAKRTAAAAVRIALDLVDSGLLRREEALARVSGDQLRKLLRPRFDPAALASARPLAQGLGSSPGQAHGAAVLDADRAADRAAAGEAVILLRPITSPQDIRGMLAASGIVTARGGALSHAAVVSRALDKPCIVGCAAIDVDPGARRFTVAGETFAEGTPLSIDGATGDVYAGAIPLGASGSQAAEVRRLLDMADAESGAVLWSSTHAASDIATAAAARPAGIGVIALTDLLIGAGLIDRFVALLVALGSDGSTTAAEAEITAIVQRATAPAIAAAGHLPLHIRLPRVSSDRARRLVENWGELPPLLFLPLGTPAYVRAILRGIAAAAGDAPVTALLGGVTDAREVDRFVEEAAACCLSAGAVIQNVAALRTCGAAVRADVPLWIDIAEVVRTFYGFPSEVIEAREALRDYVAAGSIPIDPSVTLGPLLTEMVRSACGRARTGIDASGCPPEILSSLYAAGARTFAVAHPRRDEVRLQLAQAKGGDGT